MSRASVARAAVARALRERAEQVWTGAKTGAEGAYRAGAGLVGAPQGPGRSYAPTGIGSDRTAARNYSNSGYGDPGIGSRIAADLQRDFGLTPSQTAGVIGNLGHESGGFKYYQEINPTAGRGGAGWAQWTGPRRTAFENYTRANGLNPNSYQANYGFLKNELTGTHSSALAALRKAQTVKDAVYAFEGAFEKAGVKNYASRMRYANSLGGSTISTYSGSGADPNVAAMQQHLNSLGAKLKVDGLRGPLTRAAEKNFLGSPTSVRTPSFTGPRAVSAGVTTPRTPYYSNPYTSSTGGAGALTAQPKPVPTSAIKGGPLPGAQLPSYGSNITYPSAIQLGARAVSTTAVPVTGRAPLGNVWGALSRPAIQTPSIHQPYTSSTGGANAIVQPVQTARIPQPVPQAVRAAAIAEAMRQEQMRRDAAAAAQASSRSSMGSSGYSGGGYSGGGGYVSGGYGGAGGRSIASGVGGSFKNR
jgi:hypothetical protein